MATTRLRQTFRYPDSDSDDVNDGMDEQEQETLLTTLATQDTRNTTLYTRLLLSLPLLPLPFYIPLLGRLNTFVSAVLGIISLLSSAYILYYIPLPPVSADTTPKPHTPRNSRKGKAILRDTSGQRTAIDTSQAPTSFLSQFLDSEKLEILRRFLIPINAAICAILAIYEVSQGRSWDQGMMIGGGYVPGFVFGVILVARRELRVVDLGELERLRYRFKGV